MEVKLQEITFPPFLWYIIPGLNCVAVDFFLPVALAKPDVLERVASIGDVVVIFLVALVVGFIMDSLKLYQFTVGYSRAHDSSFQELASTLDLKYDTTRSIFEPLRFRVQSHGAFGKAVAFEHSRWVMISHTSKCFYLFAVIWLVFTVRAPIARFLPFYQQVLGISNVSVQIGSNLFVASIAVGIGLRLSRIAARHRDICVKQYVLYATRHKDEIIQELLGSPTGISSDNRRLSMFPFRWIREDKWSTEPAQVIVLEFNPAHVVPAISVQPDWNNSLGIVRGVKKGEYLIEDHIREKLSYYGPPISIKEPIMGADQIRKQVWTVDEHLERFKATNQSQIVRGWVGNGNLLSNPHFVGLAHDRCYHLKTEEFKGKAYSSLVVRKTNDGRYAVAIENLTYEPDTAQPHCPTQVTKSGRIEYATFGQHIVRNGQPIDDQQLIDMAKSQQFYDLRHLFLFGRIPMGEKRWLDAGLGAFWNNGKMCVQQVENALKHQPILVNVSQFSDEDIHSAMYAKGYSKVSEPKSAGEYSLNCGTMKVILLDGVYPHNMIGIKEDGHVISVVIKGLSNRVGVSIQGAAYVMKKLGARDALLLDNGGDVMMSFEGEQVLGSAEGERKKLRSVLLFRQVSEKTNLMAEDLRLEVYPRQFRIQQSV